MKIEDKWILFLNDLENKQAFNDLRYNEQMPIQERQRLFKHYLSNWSKLEKLEKGTSERLYDHACSLIEVK